MCGWTISYIMDGGHFLFPNADLVIQPRIPIFKEGSLGREPDGGGMGPSTAPKAGGL